MGDGDRVMVGIVRLRLGWRILRRVGHRVWIAQRRLRVVRMMMRDRSARMTVRWGRWWWMGIGTWVLVRVGRRARL